MEQARNATGTQPGKAVITVRARLALALVLATATAMLTLAPSAGAATPSCQGAGQYRYCIADVSAYPSYTGWAGHTRHHCGFYPFNSGQACTEVAMTHPAWRPTSTGWSATTIAEGTQVYVHPFGGQAAWRWAWTQRTGWVAMHANDLVLYWRTAAYSSPVPNLSLDFSDGWTDSAGVQWKPEESGWAEDLSIVNGRARATYGGYDASTHYARIRRDIDARMGQEWWVGFTMTLPSDFYSRHETYMRFLTFDNYDIDSSRERRFGFLIWNSDQLPRIQYYHRNTTETTIWKGSSRLPVGTHRYVMRMRWSQSSGAAVTELYIDGDRVASTTARNVATGTLSDGSPVRFTRLRIGPDGAAMQDSRSNTVYIDDIRVSGRAIG